jgi:phage gp16-like protein
MADPIHIKPSHKGRFARDVGKKPGAKITAADIAKGKASGSAAERKRAVFAQNARKWNHAKGPRRASDRASRMYGKE